MSALNKKQNKTNKLSYNEQKEYKNLESKIRALELDKKAKEAEFLNPELSQENITKLSAELQNIIDSIEEKEMRWFELAFGRRRSRDFNFFSIYFFL